MAAPRHLSPPVLSDDDASLVARIRAGDSVAFAVLFRRTVPALRVYLYRLTRSSAVAEELAQDVFVKLWEERERLAVRTSLTGYLYTAARNHALNHLKHERVAEGFADRMLAESREVASGRGGEMLDATLATATQTAIDALPPRCREIFLLSRTTGRTYGEIAAQLGISIKTVETQMTRALTSLRRALAPHLPLSG